ncbi:MAG: RNA polymerase sigma factor SigZ [Phycisphaerales bacterium]|nr:RNA polymerase sigma factor SigZ [Phycisphaerales bacterium]
MLLERLPTYACDTMTEPAFSTERIWELLSGRLRNFILSRVSDEQIADDLLQETFLRIHKNLDNVGDEQRLASWVFRIARNLIIEYYRAKGPFTTEINEELLTTDEESDNLNKQVMGWTAAMVRQLPEGYREAVQLYEIESLSQQEIANRLGISLSGAKSRVQRGRKKLKRLLRDCCSFEQDCRGNIIDYDPRKTNCRCSDD